MNRIEKLKNQHITVTSINDVYNMSIQQIKEQNDAQTNISTRHRFISKNNIIDTAIEIVLNKLEELRS